MRLEISLNDMFAILIIAELMGHVDHSFSVIYFEFFDYLCKQNVITHEYYCTGTQYWLLVCNTLHGTPNMYYT